MMLMEGLNTTCDKYFKLLVSLEVYIVITSYLRSVHARVCRFEKINSSSLLKQNASIMTSSWFVQFNNLHNMDVNPI